MKNVAIIMAGGKGERFWPMSRNNMPKQFLTLADSKLSMIQLTVNRISQIVNENDIFIVTSKSYKDLVYEQLPNIKRENILFEPQRKNTAPCIGFATAVIKKRYSDANIIVLASDSVITNQQLFVNSIELALRYAQKQNIITLGIVPSYIETGYGYIELGEKNDKYEPIYKVNKFVEKPDYEKARQYFISGNYLWNSGMFISKNSVMYDGIKKYMPELFESIQRIYNSVDKDDFSDVVEREFKNIKSESIDYGLMEKYPNMCVIPGNFGWDDVGNWLAVERLNRIDKNKNVIDGNIVSVDSFNNIIINKTDKLVATSGVENMVIVNTEDALLVIPKDSTKDMKKLIKEIENNSSNKRYL